MTHSRHRAGQVLPIVAIFLPVIISVAGLSLTVGTVYLAQAKLQNAVDAAALAGAQEMTTGNPSDPGNQASMISQDDAVAQNPIVKLQLTQPNTVLATATATVPGSFAALFGHKTFTVKARAVATYGPGPAFDYAVFQGDPQVNTPELYLNGNVTVNGNVHSNNDLGLNGHPSVSGTCGGDPLVSVQGSGGCTKGLIQNAPYIPMPQWTPAEVTPSNATIVGSPANPIGETVSGNNNVSGNYVIYGNVLFNGNNTITGNYLVEDGNFKVEGNAIFDGTAVVFGGGIDMNGNGTQNQSNPIALAAFTSNGQVSSQAIDPQLHTLPGTIIFNGNGADTYGALYAPDSYIYLNGNVNITGAVVGYTDLLNGNVTVSHNKNIVSTIPVQHVALIQ